MCCGATVSPYFCYQVAAVQPQAAVGSLQPESHSPESRWRFLFKVGTWSSSRLESRASEKSEKRSHSFTSSCSDSDLHQVPQLAVSSVIAMASPTPLLLAAAGGFLWAFGILGKRLGVEGASNATKAVRILDVQSCLLLILLS